MTANDVQSDLVHCSITLIEHRHTCWHNTPKSGCKLYVCAIFLHIHTISTSWLRWQGSEHAELGGMPTGKFNFSSSIFSSKGCLNHGGIKHRNIHSLLLFGSINFFLRWKLILEVSNAIVIPNVEESDGLADCVRKYCQCWAIQQLCSRGLFCVIRSSYERSFDKLPTLNTAIWVYNWSLTTVHMQDPLCISRWLWWLWFIGPIM